MHVNIRQRNNLTQACVFLLVGLLLITTAGCQKKSNPTAQRLAQAGVQTADNLAAYYDALAQDTVDDWKMTTLRYAVECMDKPKYEELNNYNADILRSLQSRAHLARSISSAYKAMNDLVSYNAPGEMSEAAKGLGEAITSLAPLPDGIDPAPMFAAVGSELAAAQQSRDIRRGMIALSNIVCTTAALFKQEKPLYDEIVRMRAESADNLTEALLHRKLVGTKPLTTRITKPIGLEWTEPPKAQCNCDPNTGLLELVALQNRLLEQSMIAAGQFTLQSLAGLSANSYSYITRGAANTAQIHDSLRRAQHYLGEASKIRDKE